MKARARFKKSSSADILLKNEKILKDLGYSEIDYKTLADKGII